MPGQGRQAIDDHFAEVQALMRSRLTAHLGLSAFELGARLAGNGGAEGDCRTLPYHTEIKHLFSASVANGIAECSSSGNDRPLSRMSEYSAGSGRIMTMRGYKHIPAQYAAAFESGASIRIGTLSYYRGMEGVRGDRLEGRIEGKLSAYDIAGPVKQQDRDLLSDAGILVQGDGSINLSVSNHTVQHTADECYIFCCSDIPDQGMIADGQACFEITGMHLFAGELFKAIPLEVEEVRGGRVKYESRSVDLREGKLPVVDAFRKDSAFRFENEKRIAFYLPKHLRNIPDYLDLQCPLAAQFIRRIS